MRKTNTLFISYVKPYGAVTRSTISRWLKSLMSSAGIDISKYSAHNIRSSAASKAKVCSAPVGLLWIFLFGLR
jgi:site-specific recombinase XerD